MEATKLVLVTGSNKGIGYGIIDNMLEENYTEEQFNELKIRVVENTEATQIQ